MDNETDQITPSDCQPNPQNSIKKGPSEELETTKRKILSRRGLALIFFALVAASSIGPYDRILGRFNHSESPVGQIVFNLSAEAQKQRADVGKNPKEGVIGEVSHILPRVFHTGLPGVEHYSQELIGDRFSQPLPQGIRFSEAMKRSEKETILPSWLEGNPNFAVDVYEASNGHHIEVFTSLLSQARPKLLFPWQISGTTTSPNIFLVHPNPEKRNEETFYLGTDPYFSHANAAAVSLRLPNSPHRLTFGVGWHEVGPEAKDPEIGKTTLFYGLLYPNNMAQPATGFWIIEKGNVIEHHHYAGDLDDPNFQPLFMYIGDDTVSIIKGIELDALMKNPPRDGILFQIANSWDLSNQAQLINQVVDAGLSEEERDQALDEIQKKISGIKQSNDVVWMVVIKTERKKTIVSYALNRNHEAETIEGSYKIAAAIQSGAKFLGERYPDDRVTEAFIIHTGAEGSTANLIFAKRQPDSADDIPKPPDGVNTYSTLDELKESLKQNR